MPQFPDGRARPSTQPWLPYSEYRAQVNGSLIPLDVFSAEPDEFHGRLLSAENPYLSVVSIEATAHRATRTMAMIGRSTKSFFKVSMMLSGSAIVVQDNRHAVIGPNDLVMYDTGRPYSLLFAGEFRSLVVMIPHYRLGVPASLCEQVTAVRLASESSLSRSIVPFLRALSDDLDNFDGPAGVSLAQATVSVVESLLIDKLGRESAAVDRRDLVFESAVRFANEHISDPGLSPAEIAAAVFVSERSLYNAFSGHGTTVGTWLRERRLGGCRDALLDPARAGLSIREIAARLGYPEATSFSRAYRAMFGESPSQTRRRAESVADRHTPSGRAGQRRVNRTGDRGLLS